MEVDKSKYFEKAIEWVKRKKTDSLAVNFEGYDKPSPFVNQRTKVEVVPDIVYVDEKGNKNFVEIAIKQENFRDVITKWKLLISIASFKNGKLHLLCPKGHLSFVKKQVATYDLSAIIYSI